MMMIDLMQVLPTNSRINQNILDLVVHLIAQSLASWIDIQEIF